MIHYSNILPPIQYDSLIKRSTTTFYGVLCIMVECIIYSIKESATHLFTNLLNINRIILHPLEAIRGYMNSNMINN